MLERVMHEQVQGLIDVVERLQKKPVQLSAILFRLTGESLTQILEIRLVLAGLPLEPRLGTRAHYILQLTAHPQHEEKVTEPGMDVDVLGVFGRPGQLYASITRDFTQAARRIPCIHPNRRLRPYHHVFAQWLQEGIPRLGNLRYAPGRGARPG